MIALDFQRINDTALQQIDGLLREWLPNGRVIGDEYCIGNLQGETSKKKTGGSLRIRRVGIKAGIWKDFATGQGGNDLISLYAAKFTNNDQGAAATKLAEKFNISAHAKLQTTAPIHTTPAASPPRKKYTPAAEIRDETPATYTIKQPAAEIQAKFNKLTLDDSQCSYFRDKEITAPADIRYGKDGLGYFAAVPLYNAQGELVNFERIYNKIIEVTGTNKLTVKGAEKIGVYYPIHYSEKNVTSHTEFHFCEGLATGLCIELGLNDPSKPVIVCSTLGNIKPVITHFRDKYPDHKFVIHADNDQWKPEKPNWGLENAQKLADDFNCLISLPPFDPDLKDIYAKYVANPTDWNDFYRLNGLDTLRETIINAPKPYKYQYGKLGTELIKKVFKEPDWLIPGIIPQNSLNLLSAKPKDGKSWWALTIGLSIAHGGVALGNQKFKCTKGAVLYLALEENEARLNRRIAQLLIAQFIDMPPLFFYETKADKVSEGFEKQIDTWVKQMRAEHADIPLFVIIDTLKKVKPATTNKNLYDNDYESTDSFRNLIEQLDIAILLIHHNNKLKFEKDADPLDAISGSSGLPASVDNNLIFKRIRGNSLAELCRVGRDYTDDSNVVMQFSKETGLWTALDGDIEQYSLSDARQQIVSSVREGATSLKELSEMIDKPWETIQRTVNRMVQDGQLIRKREGRSLKLSLPVVVENHDDDDDNDTGEKPTFSRY